MGVFSASTRYAQDGRLNFNVPNKDHIVGSADLGEKAMIITKG